MKIEQKKFHENFQISFKNQSNLIKNLPRTPKKFTFLKQFKNDTLKQFEEKNS